MSDQFRPKLDGAGGLFRQYKEIGTHPITGEPVFAEIVALEAGSNPLAGLYGANVVKALNNEAANTAGGFVAWDAPAGLTIRVMGYHLVSSVAENIVLYDGAIFADRVMAVIPSAAGGPGVYVNLGNGIRSLANDRNLIVKTTTTTGGLVSGVIFGVED